MLFFDTVGSPTATGQASGLYKSGTGLRTACTRPMPVVFQVKAEAKATNHKKYKVKANEDVL